MIESAAVAWERLKNLAGFKGERDAILTATLSTSRLDDWRQYAPTFLKSEFNTFVKTRGLSKEQRHGLEQDLDYVLDVIKYEVTPQTQGLAVFVDGQAGLYERIELPFRLLNRLVIEPAPYIRPVVHALSLVEPFVVARVSRDESSLYLVDEWGVPQAEDELTGPWLRSSDRETGELSIKQYYAAARQDTLVELHYKEVGTALAKMLESSGARRVVLCAQHDIATAFKRVLPSAIAAKVAAEITFDAAETPAQMLERARQAALAARQQEIDALAVRIKEGLGAGGRGVAGFDGVLSALGRHQVQTLLVDRNYRPPGWRCRQCTWAGLAELERCPVCAGELVAVGDAVGELVRLALLQNGQVEVGENVPLLAELGGVGAVLRYS